MMLVQEHVIVKNAVSFDSRVETRGPCDKQGQVISLPPSPSPTISPSSPSHVSHSEASQPHPTNKHPPPRMHLCTCT